MYAAYVHISWWTACSNSLLLRMARTCSISLSLLSSSISLSSISSSSSTILSSPCRCCCWPRRGWTPLSWTRTRQFCTVTCHTCHTCHTRHVWWDSLGVVLVRVAGELCLPPHPLGLGGVGPGHGLHVHHLLQRALQHVAPEPLKCKIHCNVLITVVTCFFGVHCILIFKCFPRTWKAWVVTSGAAVNSGRVETILT